MYDIVILTDDRYETPKTFDVCTLQILLEEYLLMEALQTHSCHVIRQSWASDFDWSTTKMALFRSTWDYSDKFATFSSWLSNAARQTTLLHSEKIIQWNLDKHYLVDLENRGIRIVPTYFIEGNDDVDLQALLSEYKLTDAILKPSISARARDTYRVNQKNASQHNATLRTLLTKKTMLLQPFQENIVQKGEVSIIMIAGEYSHAILKQPQSGDFRVQDEFGGSVLPYQANTKQIQFAKDVVAACKDPLLYARVDLVEDNNGNHALMELEVFEPELFLRFHQVAAKQLAYAITSFTSA